MPDTSAPPAPAPSSEASPAPTFSRARRLVLGGILGAVAVAGYLGWKAMRPAGPGEAFISGNGRIEATEIDVATKLAGRVREILVNEGDFVEAGQPLALMQVEVLDAQREEARAQTRRAETTVASAQAQVAARKSDAVAARAVVGQRSSDLDAVHRRLARTETLTRQGALSIQELDDDRARSRSAEAALTAAEAQVDAAQAGVKAAEAQVDGAGAGVAAGEATIARIEADILDGRLTSPRAGRVQYRVAQPGEVLAGGGTVLNLVDLADVYMTFFLPETAAGRVAIGSEVRIILDAAADYVIPATVSFVASTAQFTPKTVETASERQKLMFRVRARMDPELLRKNLKRVKVGLPGVAWLRLDSKAPWPESLRIKVPE